MKLETLIVFAFVSTAALAVFAEEEEVIDSERGRWFFSAGPSWRSRVKMGIRGTARATPLVNPGNTANHPEAGSVSGTVDDPEAGRTSPKGQKLYTTEVVNYEYDFTPGSVVSRIDASDETGPMGLYLNGGYDFYAGEKISAGLALKFAGYWNLRASGSGRVAAGRLVTREYSDVYYYENDPVMSGDPADDGIDGYSYLPSTPNEHNETARTEDTGANRRVAARLKGDLYQIGIGPRVAFAPFADSDGWYRSLEVYGGAEALVNLVHMRLEADGVSHSRTDCRLGFGGHLGLAVEATDWCGVYGEVGYEWIDRAKVSVGDFRADIDCSSLVLSAGVVFRF